MPAITPQTGMYKPKSNMMHTNITNKDDKVSTNHQLGIEWSETIMDFKMEVKLRKLLQLCPQLWKLLEIFLAKIKGKEVVDVYRVTTSKVEDFDKPMFVVQEGVRKLGVKDGGSRANIISEELIKKLGLKRPQPTPCMVHMTNQKETTHSWK